MDLLQTFDIQDAYRKMMGGTTTPKKSVKANPVKKTAQPITESAEINRKYITFDNLITVQDAYAAMLNKKVITEDEQVQDIFSTNVETVKAAVEAGVDINTVDRLGDTPLMIAADNGQARDVVKYLISKGADVNKQNKLGSTALLYAVNSETPNAYVIDDLIQAGADVNAVSKTGNSPLGDAKAIGNQDIIDVLTAAGATEEGKAVENPDLSELTDPVADTDTSDLDNSDELSELDNEVYPDTELEPAEDLEPAVGESIEVKDMTAKPKKIKRTRPISLKKRLRPVRLSVRKPKLQKTVTFKPKYRKTIIK